MIFGEKEGPGFGLAEATRLMPVGRVGKPVHVSTLVRWIQRLTERRGGQPAGASWTAWTASWSGWTSDGL